MNKHFLSITDLSANEIWQVLLLAKKLKKESKNEKLLLGKSAIMLFEKPSLRTKLSFDLAVNILGGHSIYFGSQEIGLGKREAISDVAKVISSMADLVIARVFSHKSLEEFAKNSTVPVINALSDLEHPCQTLADLLTIFEIKEKLAGLKVAFVGDGENNVPHSLALGCALLGINFTYAAPGGFEMKKEILKKAKEISNLTGARISETDNPKTAVKNADVVYTDTWVSMGDEAEVKKRKKIFSPFQVNKKLMKLAKKDAIFMHDMPAYRGNEVTKDVIDDAQSVIFQQAENRLHAQKALIIQMFTKTKTQKIYKQSEKDFVFKGGDLYG